MKCENCNKEFSEAVFPLHILRCSKIKEEKIFSEKENLSKENTSDNEVIEVNLVQRKKKKHDS